MRLSELKSGLPEPEARDYRREIAELRRRHPLRIVVLDDDPTGIQTVHGCRLYTSWDVATIRDALAGPEGFFYLLLNSRSVPAQEAERRSRDAVRTVLAAAEGRDLRLLFISRSDSTLRGHFPIEPETIRKTLEQAGRPVSGPVSFCPALFEAGRYTWDDTQYVEQEGELVPAGRTEFARDAVFGYTSSDLRDYISEKSGGRVPGGRIAGIGVEELRTARIEEIEERFRAAADKPYLILNAVEYTDLYKLAFALLRFQLQTGSDMVVRSSSSFVPAAAGLEPRGLLGPAELFRGKRRRGLVVVGSHVRKTSEQLAALLSWERAAGIEIDVRAIAAGKPPDLDALAETVRAAWRGGGLPVLYTTREEIRIDDAEKQLSFGESVADTLVRLVRSLSGRLDFLVAKGGISSHVILSAGLRAPSARVLGQISPGVPVVLPDLPDREGFPYVVFPGNVGTRESLREIAETLSAGD
jgi:uncharacterized protein YgbK (DUF1537 family)